jgi:hypothetical protein
LHPSLRHDENNGFFFVARAERKGWGGRSLHYWGSGSGYARASRGQERCVSAWRSNHHKCWFLRPDALCAIAFAGPATAKAGHKAG